MSFMTDAIVRAFSSTKALSDLRAKEPLVQCLTNVVVAGFTANVLLALGASPAMADYPFDSAEFARVADGSLINLGTLTTAQIEAALAVAAVHPLWVLDPVGIGISARRTDLSCQLAAAGPSIIRGNASEIISLAGTASGGKGVDSSHAVEAAIRSAMDVAARYSTVVAVSGPLDFITDGQRVARVSGGSAFLTRVTGAGCSLGAVMAAFLSVCSPFDAAVAASTVYAAASEAAARHAGGPGSFAVGFLDALANVEGLAGESTR